MLDEAVVLAMKEASLPIGWAKFNPVLNMVAKRHTLYMASEGFANQHFKFIREKYLKKLFPQMRFSEMPVKVMMATTDAIIAARQVVRTMQDSYTSAWMLRAYTTRICGVGMVRGKDAWYSNLIVATE